MRCWLAIVAFAGPGCVASPKPLPAEPYVVVLGTAQDGGLPQLGCRRECCERARKDPHQRRFVTSLLLADPRNHQRWLFDASPDLAEQVERAHGHGGPENLGSDRPALFDGMFLTHAHLGHYTGLLQLGREAYGSQNTPVIATPRMLAFLQTEAPWSLLFQAGHTSARPLEAGETLALGHDLKVTAWSVPHRDEFSDTVCFVLSGPNRSLLYLPDIDKWERWDRTLAEVLQLVDFALIDGTFFGQDELPGRDMSLVPHPFIVETLQALQGLDPSLRRKVWFTHLNHSNPAANPSSPAAQAIRTAGANVLEEGQILPL